MSEPPKITPAVVARLTEDVPARLIRKLDKDPGMADRWSWEGAGGGWSVVTDRGETVRLSPRDGVIGEPAQVGCSCLLAPRCLHVLATISVLPIADDDPNADRAGSGKDATDEALAEPARVEIGTGGRSAATQMWQVASQVVDLGAIAAGAVLQTELLRAVHTCRAEGLHRLGRAGLSLLRHIRDLRQDRQESSVAQLSEALLEVLQVAWALGGQPGEPRTEAEPGWIGVARRIYRPVGGLRLHGIMSEPVVVASGYAGVITYFTDATGRLYVVSDVVPAEPSRARAAYDGGFLIGEVTSSHRQLSREGLILQDATASDDGRLGAGQGVKAVRASGVRWQEEPLASLWRRPLAEQLDALWRASAHPVEDRRSGWDLLFLEGVVQTPEGDCLLIDVGFEGAPILIRCEPAVGAGGLCDLENLRLLATAPGLSLLLVGRVQLGRPRTLRIVAISERASSSEGAIGSRLRLPERWRGLVNLGLDRLQGSFMRPGAGGLEMIRPYFDEGASGFDPLVQLRRRLERMALGGRGTMPPEALAAVAGDRGRLARCMMSSAAALLEEVAWASVSTERNLVGQRRVGSATTLARAWVRAGVYQRAATREFQRAGWI